MLLFAYLCFLSLMLAATLVCLTVRWPRGRGVAGGTGSVLPFTNGEKLWQAKSGSPTLHRLTAANAQAVNERDPLTEFKLDIHRVRSTARRVFPTLIDAHRKAALIECAGLASELLSGIDDDEMVALGQRLLERDDNFDALMDPKSVPLLHSTSLKPERNRPAPFSYLEAAE